MGYAIDLRKLKGKVVLVTGGARALGRAYALRLAKLGADIVINDINLDSAKEFGEKLTAESVTTEIEEIGVRSLGIECSVADRDAVFAMVDEILATFGRLDILINNAAIFPAEYFLYQAVLLHFRFHCSTLTLALFGVF